MLNEEQVVIPDANGAEREQRVTAGRGQAVARKLGVFCTGKPLEWEGSLPRAGVGMGEL